MNVSRLGLVSSLFALTLTGCGISIAPYPGFNDGPQRLAYHQLVMAASAANQGTTIRDGRLFMVPGPLSESLAEEDMPLEMRDGKETIELAESIDLMPMPRVRPRVEVTHYQEVKQIKPKTSVLTEPATLAVAKTARIETPSTPSLRIEPKATLEDLVPAGDEIASVRTDLLAPTPVVPSAEPKARVTNVAFVPQPTSPELVEALPLLATSTSTVLEEQPAAAPLVKNSGLLDTLDELASPQVEAAPAIEESSPREDSILSLGEEELEILMVQLENDQSGLERVRNMTPEEKAKLRAQYEKRSFLGHFAKMDRSNDGALTREEMMAYFSIMHAAFDRDYDNIVTRVEAPTLLLRIKLLGKGFPTEGLTLEELRSRLDETFKFLDKNNNDKLGWPELL